MDWTSALGALRATLPEGNEPAEPTPAPDAPKGAETLHIQFERKGRAGKSVTIIYGFETSSDDDIAALASRLKQSLGCGGSARGCEILLQGDRTAALRPLLTKWGYRIK